MPAHLVKPTFCMETTKVLCQVVLVQAPVFVHLGSRLFLTLRVLLVIYAMLDFIKKLLQMKHALHVGKTYILETLMHLQASRHAKHAPSFLNPMLAPVTLTIACAILDIQETRLL